MNDGDDGHGVARDFGDDAMGWFVEFFEAGFGILVNGMTTTGGGEN